MENFYNDSKLVCNSLKCFLELFILVAGISLNAIFIVCIHKQKCTANFKSHKPFRHLLIAMLVSDMWYLFNELNIWYFLLVNKPSLTSYNGVCQLSSYFNALFTILHEFYMLCGNYLLFKLIFPRKKSHDKEVYNQFLVTDKQKSHTKAEGVSETNCISLANLNEIRQVHTDVKCTDGVFSESVSSNGYAKRTMSFRDQTKSKAASFFSQLNFDYQQVLANKKYILEEVYYNLVVKEKLLITLNVIVWIYLLSFLIWIQGVQKLNTGNVASNAISNNVALPNATTVPDRLG